jgi:hypothetical protein
MNAQPTAQRMPLGLKIFLWLTLAIVFYWIALTVWSWLHMSPTYPPAFEKLIAKTPGARESLNRAVRIEEYIRTGAALVWSVIFLSLAWMAAFYRLNWARWTYASVFVFRQSLLLVAALFSEPEMRGYLFYSFWHDGWTNPWHYIDPVVFIAAIAFVFTGDSRNWFRRAQPV